MTTISIDRGVCMLKEKKYISCFIILCKPAASKEQAALAALTAAACVCVVYMLN